MSISAYTASTFIVRARVNEPAPTWWPSAASLAALLRPLCYTQCARCAMQIANSLSSRHLEIVPVHTH